MIGWNTWKKGFDAWEAKTAKLVERWMESPLVLEPAGAMLTSSMKLRAANQAALASWWAAWGLPTKRDQERTLHLLNRLESKILDLEERLEDAERRASAS